MKPLSLVGVLLVAFGVVVLAMRGLSYTKERDAVKVGPVEIGAEKKGFIPPVAGAIGIVVGIGLIAIGSRRSS